MRLLDSTTALLYICTLYRRSGMRGAHRNDGTALIVTKDLFPLSGMCGRDGSLSCPLSPMMACSSVSWLERIRSMVHGGYCAQVSQGDVESGPHAPHARHVPIQHETPLQRTVTQAARLRLEPSVVACVTQRVTPRVTPRNGRRNAT